jgi:ABC-type sugar transport system permease subunit
MRTPLSLAAAQPATRTGKRVGYDRRAFAWLLNTPALLAICLLSAFPIAYSAWISLHRYNLQRPRAFKFVGLSNYTDILQSPEFWTALWITVEYTALVVMLVVVLGILIALLLNREFPGRALVQTMSALRAFDVIYVLTAGGPGTATTTLTWQTYLTTFDNLDFGHGNAYAWLVSLITLALALAYFRVLYGRGDFEA